jgi:hypothetical protein
MQRDAPPAYTEALTFPKANIPSPSLPIEEVAKTLNVPPCNYVTISKKHNSVKNTILLDPTLALPATAIGTRPKRGQRENLHLSVKHGSIITDVNVVAGAPTAWPVRATIRAESKHGSVFLRIVSCSRYSLVARSF